MRLGCLGCLGTMILLLALLCLAGGGLWAWNGLHATPPLLPAPAKGDPKAVDRKLAEIGRRSSSGATRPETLALSESEVAALVSEHVADAGLPLTLVAIKLQVDQVSVQGRLPMGALIQNSPIGWIGSGLRARPWPRRSGSRWLAAWIWAPDQDQTGRATRRPPCSAPISDGSRRRAGSLP